LDSEGVAEYDDEAVNERVCELDIEGVLELAEVVEANDEGVIETDKVAVTEAVIEAVRVGEVVVDGVLVVVLVEEDDGVVVGVRVTDPEAVREADRDIVLVLGAEATALTEGGVYRLTAVNLMAN